jgi:hypothetical protein
MPTQAEELRKTFDDIVYEISQIAERWQNEPALKNFNISKSYIEGRSHVLVFFRIAGKADEYVALFRNRQQAYERDTKVLFFGGGFVSEESRAESMRHVRVAKSVVYSLDALGVSEDEIVFVTNIHPVKTPKSVFSSEVWLQKVDPSLISDAHALYLSRSVGYVLAGVLANWEIRVPCGPTSVISNQTSGQMVQCGSEIVSGIPDGQTDDGIDVNDILDYIIGEVGLRIVLGPKRGSVVFDKLPNPRFEFVDVAVGPIDF